MSKRNENPIQEHPKNHPGTSQESPPPLQAQTQTSGGSAPSSELGKYANLAAELGHRVDELSKLHTDRAGYTMEADSLKDERAQLESKVLDSVPDAGKELAILLDQELVNNGRLSALAVRIDKAEVTLHARLPLCLETFGRLRQFVTAQTLEACRKTVDKLIDPSVSVSDTDIDKLAIAMPPYVAASRIRLPGLSHMFTRPLEPETVHWNSLVRPLTEAERRAQRAETVSALISAANELCEAARRLVELAGPFGEPPKFKCEAEPVVVATVDPRHLEWLQPLGGSDEEWCKEICRMGNKPYPPVDPIQVEVLNRMLEQRHAMPLSHGIVTSAMVGDTYQE